MGRFMQQLARADEFKRELCEDLGLRLLGDGSLLHVVGGLVDILAIGAVGTVGLLLVELLNLLLGGINVLVAKLALGFFSTEAGWKTYALCLGSLVILPVVKLGPNLFNNSGNIVAAHGRVNVHKGTVLNNRGRAVEALGTSSGGASLLALLALLVTGKVLVLAVLLADKLGALETSIINCTLGLGAHTTVGDEGALLGLLGGVEEDNQIVSAADLLEVGRVASIGKDTLGVGLFAVMLVLFALGLATLAGLFAGLTLKRGKRLLLAVVLILELADDSELLLLLSLELSALVTELGDSLVSLVLLGLDLVNLGLDLGVLLRHGLLLGVLHAVLDGLDLGAELVNLLLGVVKLAKVLAHLAQAGDVGESLALVDKLHGARVDLLLEGFNLAVNLLGVLVGNLCLGGLLLGDAAADLLIEALYLIQLGSAGVLAAGLLLADLGSLGNELLAAFLGGVGLVLVLVGHGNFDLSLDGILEGGDRRVSREISTWRN